MMDLTALSALGWQPFFQQQLSLEEWQDFFPGRVVEQHKSQLRLSTGNATLTLALRHDMPEIVVGDWLLLDGDKQFVRLLDRKTCFRRKAAGEKVSWQLISANVDIAFIVSSMNEDFNLNRIERYLALVNEAQAEPVVLLSKSDLASDPQAFVAQVQQLDSLLAVVAIDGHDPSAASTLTPWLRKGTTAVVLGSSGVGKSTLINTLLGEQQQDTAQIREDDGKGRHTTTGRSLMALPVGGMILDTPGMRELKLAECKTGLASTFADIEALAQNCRFHDCTHQSEPGCAVRAAIVSGLLDQRRLDNYLKLVKEELLNSASLAEKRASDKALGKFYKRTLTESHKLKGR